MHAHNPPTHPRPYAALGTGFYRRLGTLLASISLLAFAALALSASPALAEVVHPYRTQLTGTPTGPGGAEVPFGDVCGVAVDPATQDLYVADTDNNVIDVFSSAGKYERQISGAGIPSHEFGHTGAAYHGEELFGGACSVAVSDKTGDLYVAESVAEHEGYGAHQPGFLYVFGAKGEYLKTITGFQSPHVAVDQSSGDVYVDSAGGEVVDVFNEANEYQSQIATAGVPIPWALAANSSGDVYLTGLIGGVYELNPFGSEIAQFGVGETGRYMFGVAVDSEGNVYALQTSNLYNENGGVSAVVDEFDSAGTLLHQTTGVPTGPDDRDPRRFGYSEGIAVNASGEMYVADASSHVVDVFGPGVFVAKVTSAPASPVTDTNAVLAGGVDPEGVAVTECVFEYGETEAYGKTAPCETEHGGPIGSGTSEVPVHADVTGLKPSTVYHYRLTAANANGTNYAPDATLRTTGPPTVDRWSAEKLTKTTERLKAEVNPSGFATEVYVQYGETTAYGSSTTPVDIGSGTTDQSATFELTKLKSGVTYHYRVVSSNSQNQPGSPTDGPDATFTPIPPAFVDEQSSSASSASAELSARVEDFDTASNYFFEYGSSEGCFASKTCLTTPVEAIAAASAVVPISARHVEGLLPHTLYYYRVIVSNSYGTVDGSPLDFSTLALGFPGLPDGRVFEMVTPPFNDNADVSVPKNQAFPEAPGGTGTPSGNPFQAAADGDAVSYAGDPTTGGSGEDGKNEYLATRNSEGGWSQVNVQPPGLEKPVYLAFSGELSVGVLQSADPLVPGAPATEATVYATAPGSGSYTLLDGGEGFAGGNAGTSTVPAFSHVLTFSHVLFNPGHGPEAGALADATSGRLLPVSVLPDGQTTSEAMFGAPQLGGISQQAVLDRAISADGSRIFWTSDGAPIYGGDGADLLGYDPKALYVRENDTSPDARTVLISEGEPLFWGANSEGSEVLYTKQDGLYQFDVETGQTTTLAPPAGEVKGVVGSSENGEYVYFAAGGVLGDGAARGAVPETCQKPTEPIQTNPGTPCNLYLRHAGETTFIVALPPRANGTTDEDDANLVFGVWEQSLADRMAEVTPDGRSLVFTTLGSTAFGGGGTPSETYLYSVGSGGAGSLTCVSCSPSVEVSSVGGVPPGVGAAGGFLPASGDQSNATYQQRWVSEDGDQVFFDSFSKLVPQDVNGLQNVYEWERDGAPGGSCTTSPGCVYLLTGGTSAAWSSFLDASANGENVFVITRAQLTPSDENDAYNVFDARVGGVQPPVKTECEGTGCQGVPPAPPIFATPSSATITGAESYEQGGRELNPPPPPKKVVKKTVKCKRGFVKKKNKCVRTKKKKTKAKKSAHTNRRTPR
jgi:hypothetical protein